MRRAALSEGLDSMSTNGTNKADATNDSDTPAIIRRSDMGLAISGTRISLYEVLDYLHDDWSHEAICDALTITQAQLQAALDYIETHREEVEAEFEEVVREAEERRLYHEERLRQHLASLPPTPVSPEKGAFYKWLAEQRRQHLLELMRQTERDAGKRIKAPRP
jgi:uncharacterized protein (DUF433 family)